MISFTRILTFIIFLNVSCVLLSLAGFPVRDTPELDVIVSIKNDVISATESLRNIDETAIIQYLGAMIYLAIVSLKLALLLVVFSPIITANTVAWVFEIFGPGYADALAGLFMVLFWFSFIIWVIQIVRRGEIP